MIRSFHDLRRHEEGQALVLAAISMLILTLCVLSTVNLTFAAKERIRLQNTADAAAYTTAAYQARAMNFFAYTNRAMVVHYVSQMNMMASLSYLSSTLMLIQLIQRAVQSVPVLNIIMTIIMVVAVVIVILLNAAIALLTPVIDGINYVTSLAQWATSTVMTAKLLALPGEEVRKSDPNLKVEPMASVLGSLDAISLGIPKVVNTDPTPSLGTILQPNDPAALYNRLLMTEMANAARSKFTSQGASRFTLGIIPRAFTISLGPLSFGKAARTEMGSINPVSLGGVSGVLNTLMGGLFTPTEQIFSVDQYFIQLSLGRFFFRVFVDVRARADRAAFLRLVNLFIGGNPSASLPVWVQAGTANNLPRLIQPLFSFLTAPLTQATNWLRQQTFMPPIPVQFFGQVPYARFITQPYTGARGARSGLFNQPPVMLAVTSPETYLEQRGGPFMKRFGFQLGGMTGASSTYDGYYSASSSKAPSKRGYVSQVDMRTGPTALAGTSTNGFHAVSAAMAYYHRPGDWREPPNLFNPFWGAKLTTVAEYPSIRSNPFMRSFFNANLVAH